MITLTGAGFTYEGSPTPVLAEVDLTVAPGRVVVLAGASGCGKTTITRLLGGLIPEFFAGTVAGTVRVGDLDPTAAPTWQTAAQVGSVFQNPRTQFFTTDVESEVAFGCENLGVPRDQTTLRVAAALVAHGLTELVGRSVFAMSGGEKQRLACAAVAAAETPVIVLDEPSANLDAAAMADLHAAIAGWVARGTTVVVAEHRLSYVADLVDEVIILEGGRVTHRLAGDDFRALTTAELAALGLRATDAVLPKIAGAEEHGGADDRGGGLKVEGLGLIRRPRAVPGALPRRQQTVLDIDHLEFRSVEVTALVGSNGAGKSTLLRCLAGLERPTGRISLDGGELDQRHRRELIYLVMQDVSHQLFTDSVADEVRLALPNPARERRDGRFSSGGGVPDAPGPSKDIIGQILEQFDLLGLEQRHPLSLSGGQRQRLAIACGLASGRPVLALDEPTSGLDLTHMQSVAAALAQAAAAGRTVIVATHDVELIAAVAHRVVRLAGGRRA